MVIGMQKNKAHYLFTIYILAFQKTELVALSDRKLNNVFFETSL